MKKKPYMVTADNVIVKGTDRVFYPAVHMRTGRLQPISDLAWQAKNFSSEERIYSTRDACQQYCDEENTLRQSEQN